MSVQARARLSSGQNELNELSELYSSYKQLVLALAAGLIFDGDLSGVADHAALLSEKCAVAVTTVDPESGLGRATTATALAAAELIQVVGSARCGSAYADAGLERVRQRHRALRRQVWGVLPFEYPSCASEHSHGGSHVHDDRDDHDRSNDA